MQAPNTGDDDMPPCPPHSGQARMSVRTAHRPAAASARMTAPSGLGKRADRSVNMIRNPNPISVSFHGFELRLRDMKRLGGCANPCSATAKASQSSVEPVGFLMRSCAMFRVIAFVNHSSITPICQPTPERE